MFVCVCNAVSDRVIEQAIAVHGACVDAVILETGAGTCCGKCLPWIDERCSRDVERLPPGAHVMTFARSAKANARIDGPQLTMHALTDCATVLNDEQAQCA